MRLESLVGNQLLMAQAVFAMAEHISASSGYQLTPVTFAKLPVAQFGMIACISDSTVNTWNAIIAGGGGFGVLAFYDGTNWVVR